MPRVAKSIPADTTAALGSEAKRRHREDDDLRSFFPSASIGERAGVRCRNSCFRRKGNANFAWVQHFIHHLAPEGAGTSGGMAGFVLANGSMSSNQSDKGDIRKAIIAVGHKVNLERTG